MILYFSGTGNSRYVAERIADIIGDTSVNINEKIKSSDYRKIDCSGRLVFVTPTYAWRIPKVVEEWISKTDFGGGNAWFIMTCGSEIGNAAKYNRQLCNLRQLRYMGTAQILMPENYIAMFGVPNRDEAERIIATAENDIQNAGNIIKSDNIFALPRNSIYGRIMSSIINPVFYRFFVKSDAFYAKESCISCGKCAEKCPLNNISISNGKPVWGRNCTHCMSCICNCPAEAIEYGKKSIGKPRYICKKSAHH